MLVKSIQQRFERLLLMGIRHAQFIADGGQQLHDRQSRVKAKRDIHFIQPLFQQCANQSGLAGANFSGQLHEAAVFMGAVQQVR